MAFRPWRQKPQPKMAPLRPLIGHFSSTGLSKKPHVARARRQRGPFWRILGLCNWLKPLLSGRMWILFHLGAPERRPWRGGLRLTDVSSRRPYPRSGSLRTGSGLFLFLVAEPLLFPHLHVWWLGEHCTHALCFIRSFYSSRLFAGLGAGLLEAIQLSIRLP